MGTAHRLQTHLRMFLSHSPAVGCPTRSAELYGVVWMIFIRLVSFPFISAAKNSPNRFRPGNLTKFSWDSAWWTFNFVANFAEIRWNYAIIDIQDLQSEQEGRFFALQPAIEKTALELYKTDKELAANYLTDYSVSHADMIVKKWKELGEHLIQKYNDGYLIDKKWEIYKEIGYPEEWYREVVKEKS